MTSATPRLGPVGVGLIGAGLLVGTAMRTTGLQRRTVSTNSWSIGLRKPVLMKTTPGR